MKILIYISHPAQFHFLKNTIEQLKMKGHQITIAAKTKDVLTQLIIEKGWDFHNIQSKERGNSKLAILWGLIKRNLQILKLTLGKNYDLLIGTDACIAHIGKMLNINVITTLEDDYQIIRRLAKLTYPFTTNILVPEVCDVGKWQNKKIAYQGYMKLAYLHPNWFKPNRSKVAIPEENYIVVRLSGLQAHHDFGMQGITEQQLDLILKKLETHARVYITSETPLPTNLQKYKLSIPVSDIHHYLFYAKMLVCDSQSMAVEASILGIPGVRISSFAGKISVLEELEHVYGLTYGFEPNASNNILEKIQELLSTPNLKKVFKKKQQKMLSEKIDVTAFMIWFIENYPQSKKTMINNPDFQFKFK